MRSSPIEVLLAIVVNERSSLMFAPVMVAVSL